ncbi:MAG: hypothetical protein RhofKO_37560 [Rhodothermales bacterium]
MLGDTDDEIDETFTLELTNLSVSTVANPFLAVRLCNDDLPLPTEIIIKSVYPNLFRQQATLEFALPEALSVRIAVYDVRGRLVSEPFAGELKAGHYEQPLHLDGQAAGLFFLRMETAEGHRKRAITLVR